MKKYILLFLVFIAITGFQIDQDTNTILYNQDGVVITLLDEDKIACKNVNVISISIKGKTSKNIYLSASGASIYANKDVKGQYFLNIACVGKKITLCISDKQGGQSIYIPLDVN